MKIKELRELVETATGGPWVYKENGISYVETTAKIYGPDKDLPIRIAEYTGADNGRFIAVANPQVMLKLLAVVEAAGRVVTEKDGFDWERDQEIDKLEITLKDLEND